jgi:hypothetical protein
MQNWMFVSGVALFLTTVFIWCFRALPRERWQILCAVPVQKLPDGKWRGVNLTYYGLFNAAAVCAAVSLALILTGAAGMDFRLFSVIVIVLLSLCLPASGQIARWVEKKPHTFSVGAASFLGIILGPWLLMLIRTAARQTMGLDFEIMAAMAALLAGYALGEGIGRLGCISFGCCYGKPVDRMPPAARRFLSWACFTYSGGTKKITYAHGLEGQKIFAVQAVTAVLYTVAALSGALLILNGDYAWACFLCLSITQAWRFLSEFLRADYRGGRSISVYQVMSLLTIPYGLLLPFIFTSSGKGLNVLTGLRALWDPVAILFLLILWGIIFLKTGISQVTGSYLSFHVHRDRI